MTKLFASIRQSIFIKLLLIFLVATVLIFVIVGGAVRHYSDSNWVDRATVRANFLLYTDYLVGEIGTPPDTAVASRLAQDLGLRIRIEHGGNEWSSTPESLPNLQEMRMRSVPQRQDVQWGRARGHLHVVQQRGATSYVLMWGGLPVINERTRLFFVLIAAVSLVLVGAYLLVRWLFRPIKWLSDGVVQVSAGDLQTNIPVRKHDEFGELARSFNHMSTRLGEMMRAKDQLLLDVSHELRSPMTRMKVALEFVNDTDARQRIASNLNEMETMVEEILESERISSDRGALHLTSTDLGELIQGVIDTHQEAPPGVRALESLQGYELEVDARRIEIAVRNVVQNALKHSITQSRPVEVSLSEQPHATCIQIRDFGEGIPEDEQALVFEPFYRVDKSRGKDSGGFGLGLSLTKKIVEAHGGKISLDSKLGVGSTFVLTLPSAGKHRTS